MAHSQFVIDTHALIWFLEDNPRLGKEADAVISTPHVNLFVPTIVLSEAAWIIKHGRTRIPSIASLLEDLDADPRIQIINLDRRIVCRAFEIEGIEEMHDRLIVATALELSTPDLTVAILSRDRNITNSGLSPVVW